MGDSGTFIQSFETNVGVSYTNSDENYLSVNRAMLKPEIDYYPLNFSASKTVKGILQNAGYGIEEPKIETNDFEKLNPELGNIFLIEKIGRAHV